ncbi:MAG: hypothetical protein IJK06_11715 [Clostridia bacterium]|nr:hypothetical protein [Clostridia bacterium]
MKNTFSYDAYMTRTHWLGRIFSVTVLIMLIGAPFVIGGILGSMPDLAAAGKGIITVGLIWMGSGIVEYLVYTPMLGAGGSYLAFITGNLINMKIPCAVNARELTGAKTGTAENEVISTLSIATSSLVTILVLALGVVLMIPLRPVLDSEVLRPGFDNVVAALFGAMACQYFRKDLKLALVPMTIMTVLFILVPSLTGSASFMIIPSGAIAIGLSWLKYRREKKGDA